MTGTPTSLTIVSPVAQYSDAAQGSAKHAERRGIAGMRALLLPAEKSSSPPFIQALVQRLAAETPVRRTFTRNPEWAFFHPERAPEIAPEVDALARECDVMITGVAY
jgi:hypothetical protein